MTDSQNAPSTSVRTPLLYSGVYTCLWFLMTAARAWTLNAGAFDLGYFTQAIGRIGSESPETFTGWHFFEDHFSPLALILAPFVRGAAAPYVLLAAQSLAAGVSVWLAYRLAYAITVNHSRSIHLMVAYSVSPALAFALWFDFHPTILGLSFLILALHSLISNSATELIVGISGLSLAREDLAALALLLVIMNWLSIPRVHRWVGLIPLAALAVSFSTTRQSWFVAQSYGYLKEAQSFGEITQGAAAAIWGGGLSILLLGALLLPWLFMRMRFDRNALVALLWIMPLLLSEHIVTKYAGFHYYAPIPALLLVGTASSVSSFRLNEVRIRASAGTVASLLVGPLLFAWVAPSMRTLPVVLADARSRQSEVEMARQLTRCIESQGLSLSAIDPVVAISDPLHPVFVWPVPFANYEPFVGVEPLVRHPPDPPRIDVLFAPGSNWDRPSPHFRAPIDPAGLGYFYIGRLGDDWIELWARPNVAWMAAECLDDASFKA